MSYGESSLGDVHPMRSLAAVAIGAIMGGVQLIARMTYLMYLHVIEG